jgi:hypothetical protein
MGAIGETSLSQAKKPGRQTKLAVEPSRAEREISNFASLPRDRFALIQLTYGRAQMIGPGSSGLE